jgi:hypothetical protein
MTNIIRLCDVNTFDEFVKFVELTPVLFGTNMIYRGQIIRGNLIPSVARKDFSVNTTERERSVLDQLALLGANFKETEHQNMLELMVTAQHFGLKTRLLDWTSNPLAALWFACKDSDFVDDAYVYIFSADHFLDPEVYSSDPFTHKEMRVFQPRQNNARIVAQHSWFTLHCYSSDDQGFVPLELNESIGVYLYEIRIPATSREKMLLSLDRCGINYRVLFPDFEGLCHYLNS